jgi:nucleotide-binding universal stress UspA family protein
MLTTKRGKEQLTNTHWRANMAPKTIVSYDDTLNDHDALALGRLLSHAGAELELAYVRHTTQAERSREELEEHEAEALLERGARWLDDLDVPRRVLVSGSTGEGLAWLAEHEDAQIIVFGSDYRTAAGHVQPGTSAQHLIEGGPAALAVAPANYRSEREPLIRTIGLIASPGDDAAIETARGLAEAFGATVTRDESRVDVLVVGSRPEAPQGRVMVTAQAEDAIENATAPVLIVPRGVPVRFGAAVASAG